MSFRDTKQNSRSSSVDLNSESVPYYDDSESVVSSYAASVISVESLASSATDLSRGSGYSTHQIATATKELVTIFQEDDFLKPLYKRAIRDDSIGPEKLQRNLRRLFKKYAEHLKDEAKDGLEYLAARLVSLKARFVAHTIVQSINSEDQPRLLPKLQVTSKDDSSADEEETQAVDETTFENLVTFREFLVGSDAFRTLKTQIQSFVLPKAAQAPPERTTGTKGKDYAAFREDTSVINFGFSIPFSHVSVQTLNTHIRNFFMPDNARNSQEKFKQRWNEFLVLTGQMEPPLEPGKIRLRWQCGCRQNFTGDFAEYKDGGIADLVSRIEQSTGTKVTITSHNSTISNQKSTGQHPGLWIRNALTRLTTTFRKPTKQCTLPQHNPTTTTCCPAPPTGSRSKMIHLLSCMHAGRFRKSLAQDRIESINTDRNLFCFLRQQFRLHRGRFSTLLSLKTVQGIYFIKFRLPMGGSVEVRHHNPCCVSPQPCECIPPAHRVEPSPRAEYRCIPGPPSVWPPIDPHYLAHLFTTPTCINENDTWILDQLPKRICGELQGKAGQPAEGWGIYYQEGWDRDVITLGVFGIFLVASLIFGVLWSCLKMDVQGAFGVSAYMVAACGVFVSLVTVKVDKV
ncbi:hypothetical protein P280DRAFT_394746 [Massarina eburnea CBS 473.64]|uniref:Uncharacterized protein n=1 Tax=Massarina eburnea CBS 473.64 TaxID=1395130 RepID=A0A6A6S909_9PLEO|nr:hypothetical protein P280DRAFT_394746 [Massarina eburnea CBS 473.64]